MGDEVPKGSKAKTGLYAILDRHKDTILRVALSKDIAETLCDYDSRYVKEAFISDVKVVNGLDPVDVGQVEDLVGPVPVGLS